MHALRRGRQPQEIQQLRSAEVHQAVSQGALLLSLELPVFPHAVLYQQPLSAAAVAAQAAAAAAAPNANTAAIAQAAGTSVLGSGAGAGEVMMARAPSVGLGGVTGPASSSGGDVVRFLDPEVRVWGAGGAKQLAAVCGCEHGSPGCLHRPHPTRTRRGRRVCTPCWRALRAPRRPRRRQVGRDNPAEAKAAKLARSVTRGVIDRQLKPNSDERRAIAAVLRLPPNKPLSQEAKALLWRFR
jgi:hypothetical protein